MSAHIKSSLDTNSAHPRLYLSARCPVRKTGYRGLFSSVSFILTENQCLVEVVARRPRVGLECEYRIYGWTWICFQDCHNGPVGCHSLSIVVVCGGVSEQQ